MTIFWRIHPDHRPFSVEDATSAPFFVSEPFTTSDGISGERSRERRSGDPVQQGYSCFENPWHLYLYLWNMWPFMLKGDSATVISFEGRQTGRGHDGENLAVPVSDHPRSRMSLGQFRRSLPSHPLPSTPAYTSGLPFEMQDWSRLAERWGYLELGYPEQDYVVQRFSAKTAVQDPPPGLQFEVRGPHGAGSEAQMEIAAILDGQKVGELWWMMQDGFTSRGMKIWSAFEISTVTVEPAYRRQGIAAAMLSKAREIEPRVRHSEALLPDGAAWSQAVASSGGIAVTARQHDLPARAEGPILRNWKGYSTESQQRILAAYEGLVEGRLRPEPKQRPPLVGFWTAKVDDRDRIIVDDLPGGGWVLLGAVFEHNYDLAEEQMAGWLAWKMRTSSKTAAGPVTLYRFEHRPPDADLSRPETLGVHWTTKAIDYGYAHEPGWKRVVWQATVDPEAIEDATDRFGEGEVVLLSGAVVHLTGRTERMKGPYVDVKAGQPEFPMSLDVPVKGTRISSVKRTVSAGGTWSPREPIVREISAGGETVTLVWDEMARPVLGAKRRVTAHAGGIGGMRVGWLSWDSRGIIEGVVVHESYRRRGIASEMLRVAREVDPGVTHSHALSDDGGAWSQVVGSKPRGWRPTEGMFDFGSDILDPRIFDPRDRMRPEVRNTVINTLDAYWTPKYGNWRRWARVYLAGSGASFWWDSDADMDILIGVDIDRLRFDRPANVGVADADILARLNKGLQTELRPTTTALLGFEATWYINEGAYDIRALKPYAAYDLTTDEWVQRPPVLPEDWGPHYIDDEVWAMCEEIAAEADMVLALPEPERSIEGTTVFNAVHEARRLAYTSSGEGWLDPGNIAYQYLSQRGTLRELYLCKHPEEAGIEKAAASEVRQVPVSVVLGWKSADAVSWDRAENLPVGTILDEKRQRPHYQSLVEDVRRNGIRDPLIKSQGLLVDGHTRLAAAVDVGLDTVPVQTLSRDEFRRFRDQIRPDITMMYGSTSRRLAWQQSQSRDHATTMKMLDQCRSAAQGLSLDGATALTRRVLTDAGFPRGGEAEAVRHPRGYGTSSVAWDVETQPAIPLVALANDMQDEFTVLHECAHIIRNGPSYAGKQGDALIAHDDQWFITFSRLLSWYGTNKVWRQFQYVFGTTPSPSRTASSDPVFEHLPSHSIGDSGPEPTDRGIDTLVAYVGGSRVGWISWMTEGIQGSVDALWVDPAHRRQGIATRLLREAQQIFPEVDPRSTPWFTEDGERWVRSLGVRTPS